MYVLNVNGREFLMSKKTMDSMLDVAPRNSYTKTGKRTIYLDRNPLWIDTIANYYRGYTTDFSAIIKSTNDEQSAQILI